MTLLAVMNVPKAAEIAVALVLRQYAEMLPGTTLRPWQSLNDESSNWDAEKDRTFPQVDIRFSPIRHSEDQHTMETSGQIMCGTYTDADRDHNAVSQLFEGVERVLNTIFFQFLSGATEDIEELTTFQESLTTQLGEDFSFGGLEWGEPMPPFDDKGVNAIGHTFILNFARKDY